MPCPDVYWFPVASPRFCQELIEICETYGKWSDGSNKVNIKLISYKNVNGKIENLQECGFIGDNVNKPQKNTKRDE